MPYKEATLYRLNIGNTVYLALSDQYWEVYDEDTLEGVFGTELTFTQVDELPSPVNYGPKIGSGSALWQNPNKQNRLYFVCAGDNKFKAYWITSEAVQARYQFKGPVQTTSNYSINNFLQYLLPYGDDIV